MIIMIKQNEQTTLGEDQLARWNIKWRSINDYNGQYKNKIIRDQ